MTPKSASIAVEVAVILLRLARAFQEYARPTPAAVGLTGIGLGLTLGTRVIGGIALLYAAAAGALIYGAEWRALGPRAARGWLTRFVGALLPGVVLAYLVVGVGWAWAGGGVLHPLRAA